MRGFGLKDSGFFICTETTPRCYVIQEVNDVNRALDDLNKTPGRSAETNSDTNASEQNFPSLPLPWWFTSECRQQLLNVQAPPPRASTPNTSPINGYESSSTPEPPSGNGMTAEQLRIRLKSQLEYYFSENLMNDRFLRSQMDSDQYVPIKVVANFPKITRLTIDYELIVNVLRESTQVQVDESGEKVRPVTKRCTIILREIPEDANEADVKAMFDSIPYQTLSYAANNSWYVTFATEDETQKAFLHLQNVGITFNNKPVYARIKTGGAPIVTDSYQYGSQDKITTNAGVAYKTNVGITPGGETVITGQITIHDVILPSGDVNTSSSPSSTIMSSSNSINSNNNNIGFTLGQMLANYGYLPRASFRPSVTSTAAMTQSNSNSSSSALSFTTPQVPVTMPLSIIPQQPSFLQRMNMPYAKYAYIDTNSETEKNKENSQLMSKDSAGSKKSSSDTHKSNTSTSHSGRSSNRSSFPPSTNNSSNKSISNINRNNIVLQSPVNYNIATPLNKVNTHDPDSVTTTNLYNKDGNYQQRNTREFRPTSNQSERRDRPTNNQGNNGRSEQRNNSASRQSHSTRNDSGSGTNYYANSTTKSGQSRSETQRTSNRQYTNSSYNNSREVPSESALDKNVSYDFAETDFPRLVEKEFKRQNSKQTSVKEERAQFSAVVAGRKAPKVVEEKRSTYAQTLKRSAK